MFGQIRLFSGLTSASTGRLTKSRRTCQPTLSAPWDGLEMVLALLQKSALPEVDSNTETVSIDFQGDCLFQPAYLCVYVTADINRLAISFVSSTDGTRTRRDKKK